MKSTVRKTCETSKFCTSLRRVDDLDAIVRGEFAENAERKDFLPSEIDAIRRALDPIERAEAKARMSDGAKGSESFATLPGKASDKIGALTWKKPRKGMGVYFRGQTEHVLFAVRGSLGTRRRDIPTIFEAPRGRHSEKPEKLYEIVRAASYPPYGEAFQRKPRPDFINLFARITDEAPPHPLDIPPSLRRAAP